MSGFDFPADNKLLLTRNALELIEHCQVSQGNRAAYYKSLNSFLETGRNDGKKSLVNLLFSHVDRLASHLFSPTDLRFTMDFENPQDAITTARGFKAANIITKIWERNNTDILFGQGVFGSLVYGAAILKQWPEQEGEDRTPVYRSSLVMPWQFGVYREDVNDLDRQPAVCETVILTKPEVWRRIYHMPNADALMKRIVSHSDRPSGAMGLNQSFHQIISASQINTSGLATSTTAPGGIVGLSNAQGYAITGPEVSADMFEMKELWAWDGDDYVTIQIIMPDILISPRFKKSNLLISGDVNSGLHPYDLIQANMLNGYTWGRSELVDLTSPQDWLSETADDAKRMLALQVDKFLSITSDGVSEERYAAMRAAGFLNLPPGSSVTDLTPKFPAELMPMLEFQKGLVDLIGGFDNMLSGRGESGVRSGVQNNTMLKTASPRLRDRSLLAERQCAGAADKTLALAQAKDGRNYWTDSKNVEKTSFLLSDLPEDRRIVVDSHSSSPIFQDDHQNLIFAGLKAGFIDGEMAIEMLNLPMKDTLIQRLREKEEKKEKLMADLAKNHPEEYVKLLTSHHR
jgi:hypothetical protein